jgi:hypothetical protein
MPAVTFVVHKQSRGAPFIPHSIGERFGDDIPRGPPVLEDTSIGRVG